MLRFFKSCVFSLCLFSVGYASQSERIVGHWEGTITREGKIWRVWMDIRPSGAGYQATADFPDYGLYAMPATITLENDKAKIGVVDGRDVTAFDGQLSKETIAGEWKGLNLTATFQLRRTDPRPFDLYVEEEVTFQNGDANLAGTLVRPKKAGRHPAVVFTHGSGNQTRTQSFYRSRAYFFARNGIAALIYDRRGTGSSKGGGDDPTWICLADDALAGVRALQTRPDINPRKIGISGFSQGGWVSPLAAARSRDIAFVLVGSASGVTPDEQNNYSVESVLRTRKVPDSTIKAVMDLRGRVRSFQHAGKGDKAALETEISSLRTESWFRNALLPERLEQYDAGSKAYLTFDPAPIWERVTVPVLSLWGSLDTAVPPEKSKTILERSLRKGGNKDFQLRIFPKAGHGVGVVRDAGEPWDFPRLAPGYQEAMIDWLSNRVRPIR